MGPLIREGAARTILASRYNGGYPILEFFEMLENERHEDFVKTMALLDRAADNWPIRNREKYKAVERDLFEFKSHQIRVLCFERRSLRPLVVLAHGVIKKKNELDKSDITRAENVRDYFDQAFDLSTMTYKGETR